MPGFDGLLFGPGDFSHRIGKVGQLDTPEVVAARKREAYLGFPEALFVRLNALLPGLVDQALSGNDRKAARLFAR